MATRAREASRKLQAMPTEERVAMLHRVADALLANEATIMAENAKASLTHAAHSPLLAKPSPGGRMQLDAGTPARAWLSSRDHASAAATVQDVEEATGKIVDALLQRLILKPSKISQLADGIRAIAAQEEPIRRTISRMEVAQGAQCARPP
jgi:gamma-glutamyl phosphate reductase